MRVDDERDAVADPVGVPHTGHEPAVVNLLVLLLLLAVQGLIIGAFARLALPGKDPLSLFQTMGVGIAGSLLAGVVAYLIAGENAAPGFLGGLVFAVVIMYLIRRSRGGGLTRPSADDGRAAASDDRSAQLHDRVHRCAMDVNGPRCQHAARGSAALHPLGRRLRRDGDLRQARLRGGHRGRRPAAGPLRAGRGGPARGRVGARRAARALAPRRARVARDGRGRLRDAVRAVLLRARADGRLAAGADPLHVSGASSCAAAVALGRERASARRIAALLAASAGAALVLAGRGDRELRRARRGDGLRRRARVHDLHPRRRPRRDRRAAARARGARLHGRGVDVRASRPWRAAGPTWRSARRAGAGSARSRSSARSARSSTFFAGLARVGPSAAAILSVFEPVVTVALAAAAFGESLALVQLAGGALVLAAVVVMQWPARVGFDLREALAPA